MAVLNAIGQRLANGLAQARQLRKNNAQELEKTERINVVGAGSTLTAAYEQLRNAAENSEEHLLLQNAIKRFYRRIFLVHDNRLLDDSGEELVTELTFAGYLSNNSLTKQQTKEISRLAKEHHEAFLQLQGQRSLKDSQIQRWILDVLAYEVARVIYPRYEDEVFCEFAHEYFSLVIPQSIIKKTEDFGAVLFLAVQQALLKSDPASMRASLLRRYGVKAKQIDRFFDFNKSIDKLLESPSLGKLCRTIDRQGAPLRILRRTISANDDISGLLSQPKKFLNIFEQQIRTEYRRVSSRVNRAVFRSVLFLIITKVLIGIAIEIPYDLVVYESIIWLPLIINLFFPPVYMILLRLTLKMPGRANTQALMDRIEPMLYSENQTALTRVNLGGKRYSTAFSMIYTIMGLIVFALVSWLLLQLQFAVVHIVIFIVFVSAASFLSFRLGHLVRELEVTKAESNGFTMVRDFIYLPFVVLGQWMSEKYKRFNFVAMILDIIIEMPLKTTLRLIRQWNSFIDDRKDNLF